MIQVKEENLKLKSENSVLGQYIENLMQVKWPYNFTDASDADLVGYPVSAGRISSKSHLIYGYGYPKRPEYPAGYLVHPYLKFRT
jgi:Short coiled-coil protein